jgi:uncharacterized membrane protein YqjE
LNRDIDEEWIDWAIEMIENGYDTEHLIILAGITKPYNQFQLQELTDRVLWELDLNWRDQEKAVKGYVLYLIEGVLNGRSNLFDTLHISVKMSHSFGESEPHEKNER